ncbi:hypothetical protein AW878_02590 [Bordetella pseudohinzii]|uniref:Uncharacterized protein n=1 Tax=Bordetella pseudohinzii TaxID=1331258 RepID=A0ABM6DGF5_9BORD|nr:hypothetical protein BBN53_11975 [Bordetella pseudohinzii]KMM27701.1 hypothetical protein L540_01495 [Bordetella pseudohinzii]KXA82155.1 hypothetical protein AW878_02590 [Bordetella pseudohinzii]
MTLARMWIAQDKRIAQQFFQGNSLVGQQRMPCRHRDHERIAPGWHGDDAIAYLIRLCKSNVV